MQHMEDLIARNLFYSPRAFQLSIVSPSKAPVIPNMAPEAPIEFTSILWPTVDSRAPPTPIIYVRLVLNLDN